MPDREKCHLVVCADVAGRRKRPQRITDRRWNGQPYYQRPREPDVYFDALLTMITKAKGGT